MVNGNNNVKEWTGVHSSLVVSLHKITMRFTWALQHNT
jgi:hypothetical protein